MFELFVIYIVKCRDFGDISLFYRVLLDKFRL